MIRGPPSSTRPSTLVPYPLVFLSRPRLPNRPCRSALGRYRFPRQTHRAQVRSYKSQSADPAPDGPTAPVGAHSGATAFPAKASRPSALLQKTHPTATDPDLRLSEKKSRSHPPPPPGPCPHPKHRPAGQDRTSDL